ncbi:MAG: isoprenylcysteine carboxylmethyltransferase family protein [Armatimonadota bacterium]|nr:isoprenylcysteine carboxylmethyltransferase family protein [Armatimonadota bacterium]
MAGEVVRFWAAGYIRKCVAIATSGPFGSIRNPLYVGSFLITLGYCVMANSIVVLAAAMLAFCVFHGAAIFYEERYLTRLFGNQFIDYCKSVPRLFPRWPRGGGEEQYSFRCALENREHISAIFAGIVALAFALKIALK